MALAGASPALTRPAAFDPEALRRAVHGRPPGALRRAAGDLPAALAAIRRRTVSRLLAVAAADLTGRLDMPAVGRALSDAADEAAAAALAALAPALRRPPPLRA